MQYSLKYLLKRFGHEQFVGKSSSIRLLQQALNMREAATATPMPTSSQPPEIKVKGFHYRLEDNPVSASTRVVATSKFLPPDALVACTSTHM